MKPTRVIAVPDFALVQTVALAEQTPTLETDVILQVDGALITGRVIGTARFLDLHFKNMENDTIDPTEEHSALMAKSLVWQKDVAKQNLLMSDPSMLLLTDVTISGAWGKVSMNLWRVPIERVSGWYEGVLEPVKTGN